MKLTRECGKHFTAQKTRRPAFDKADYDHVSVTVDGEPVNFHYHIHTVCGYKFQWKGFWYYAPFMKKSNKHWHHIHNIGETDVFEGENIETR